MLTDGPATPEELHETTSDLSIAFLIVLERLAPEARAAFLLHEVLDVEYDEIAPDGVRSGDPRLCSPDTGAKLVEQLTEIGARFVQHYAKQFP